ncbi:MAG: hypothetical protein LBU95_04900 [Rikenellaceae bacterium]|jgi:hypothetical protein|nr:hypothetical protein [Rikenellaceae bacterium]
MKDKAPVLCPICGSDNVSPARASAPAAFLSILLLGFPFLFCRSRQRHCFDCGTDFMTGGNNAQAPDGTQTGEGE